MANTVLLIDWKEEQLRLQNRLRDIEQKIKVSHEKVAAIDSILINRITKNQSTINKIDSFLQAVSKHLER